MREGGLAVGVGAPAAVSRFYLRIEWTGVGHLLRSHLIVGVLNSGASFRLEQDVAHFTYGSGHTFQTRRPHEDAQLPKNSGQALPHAGPGPLATWPVVTAFDLDIRSQQQQR